MNVICLPDSALTGDFGTGIAGLSLLSRFGRNICTATPSPEALVGLIPSACADLPEEHDILEEAKPDDDIYIRPAAVPIPHRFYLAEKEGEVLLGSHHRAFLRFPREAATRGDFPQVHRVSSSVHPTFLGFKALPVACPSGHPLASRCPWLTS